MTFASAKGAGENSSWPACNSVTEQTDSMAAFGTGLCPVNQLGPKFFAARCLFGTFFQLLQRNEQPAIRLPAKYHGSTANTRAPPFLPNPSRPIKADVYGQAKTVPSRTMIVCMSDHAAGSLHRLLQHLHFGFIQGANFTMLERQENTAPQ